MERSLSQNEARVVLDLEWRGQKTVTLAELRKALGGSENYTRVLAHHLVKKGWLERLCPGVFQLVPASRGREGVPDTHPLVAGAALVSPYFFSFGTACTHHGLTEQVFAEVYVACMQHRNRAVVRDTRYVFVPVPERRFFGFARTRVLQQVVNMATVERVLLDVIDRPRYAGGLGEASRVVVGAATKVKWPTLLEHLRRWASSALVQRLGFFLDLNKVELPDDFHAGLINLIRPRSKIQLGPRGPWGTQGKLTRPWNVVENVPRSVLIPPGEQRPRRVVFRSQGSGS